MRVSDFLYPESITRCQHIKVNGVQCGSPSLKNKKFCFFHEKSRQRGLAMKTNRRSCWRLADTLPLLEDANSIQLALMQIMRLLIADRIEHKQASLLLYALQTASSNLRNTTFEPRPEQVVIDRRGVADTLLGDQAWYKEEFEEEEKGAEASAEAGKALESGEEETNASKDAVEIEACADPARPATSFRQNNDSNNRSSYNRGSYFSGSYQGTPFRRAEKAVVKKAASAAGALPPTSAAKAVASGRLSGIAEAMP